MKGKPALISCKIELSRKLAVSTRLGSVQKTREWTEGEEGSICPGVVWTEE